MSSVISKAALAMIDNGFSAIPTRGKVCALESWGPYQERFMTAEEVALHFAKAVWQ